MSVIQFGSEFRGSRNSEMFKNLTGITIGEIIGKGNFGNVYRGDWNGNPVALKSLKSDDYEEMKNELTLLRNLVTFQHALPIVMNLSILRRLIFSSF